MSSAVDREIRLHGLTLQGIEPVNNGMGYDTEDEVNIWTNTDGVICLNARNVRNVECIGYPAESSEEQSYVLLAFTMVGHKYTFFWHVTYEDVYKTRHNHIWWVQHAIDNEYPVIELRGGSTKVNVITPTGHDMLLNP